MAKDGLTKIYDKDIAKELNMSQEQFSQMKNNDKIPFEKIVLLCMKNNININWVLDTSRFPNVQIESTQYIFDWFHCRKFKYKRILAGLTSSKCKKISTGITYSSHPYDNPLPIKHEENEKQINIFNPLYMGEPLISKITKKVILILIVLAIGYFLGYQKSKIEHSIENYEKRINKTEKKYNNIKENLADILRKLQYQEE